MAELVEMRAQRVHGFGALFHELLPRPERDGPGLLVRGLRLHEPHGRPKRCLDNGLGEGGIVLLALDERLDVVRRDQPDIMSVPRHLPRPVMGTRAGLNRHAA